MAVLLGFTFGFAAWFVLRWGLLGFFTVQQNERAVKTSFGRAKRIGNTTIADSPLGEHLRPEERERYAWPQVVVIPPGGPYFKWPWEKVHKVSVATQTHSLPKDPESPSANHSGTMLDAVTKDGSS